MVRSFILLIAVSLSACAGNSVAPTVPVNREVTLAVGQSVSIVDSVAIKFVGVQGDSRCPADAMCIQGGDALVKLQVSRDRDTRDVELHTGNTQPATYEDFTIALVQLSPYPFSSRTIEPDEYRVTVRVTR
jgi:hypothetical protein